MRVATIADQAFRGTKKTFVGTEDDQANSDFPVGMSTFKPTCLHIVMPNSSFKKRAWRCGSTPYECEVLLCTDIFKSKETARS